MAQRKKARKQFFFEKKNQKTFVPGSVSLRDACPKKQEPFAFAGQASAFSSEKALLLREQNLQRTW